MMKMNKKGFTIVELVIVIAVIAILAAVMIPTFSGIIDKANQSAAQQKAAALWKELYARDLADGTCDGIEYTGTDKAKALLNDVQYCTYTPLDTDTDGAGEDTQVWFEYNDTKYTATFNGTAWAVTKN